MDINIETNLKEKINVSLVYLTLSAKQVHSDKDIEDNVLSYFFKEMTEKHNLKQYISFTEKNKKGDIYFKVILKGFFHWEVIRNVWNKAQNQKGFAYVDAYSAKMQEFFKDGFKAFSIDDLDIGTQYKAYLRNKENNWTQPNSTDIVALHKNDFSFFNKQSI